MTSESRVIEIDSKGETESDEAPRASVDTGRNAGMNALCVRVHQGFVDLAN